MNNDNCPIDSISIKEYYNKLQTLHDGSLKKKDTFTNWSLTITAAFFGIYFGLSYDVNNNIDHVVKISILTTLLIILIQFFCNSLIAYSYLRKWRHLQNCVEFHWLKKLSYGKLIDAIVAYDHNNTTNVGMLKMIRAQLSAGFHIILIGPTLILIYEFSKIQNFSFLYCLPILILSSFIIWEIISLKNYDKIQKNVTT